MAKQRSKSTDVGRSLEVLAKSLGYDARIDSINCGDRGYYQREKMDLDELYENYWEAKYRQHWFSAFYALGEAEQKAHKPIAKSAFATYLAATRSAAGTKSYEAQLPKGGGSSISVRMNALRFHDGKKLRPIELVPILDLIRRDKFR